MTNVNPICGRKGCKYKVAHEHVQFPPAETAKVALADVPMATMPHKSLGMQVAPRPIPPPPVEEEEAPMDAQTEQIAKAIRALAACDDPSADKFNPEAAKQNQVLDAIAALSNQLNREYTKTVERLIEYDEQNRQRWAEQVVMATDVIKSNDSELALLKHSVVERYNLQNKRTMEIYVGIQNLLHRRYNTPFAKIILGVLVGNAIFVSAIIILTAVAFKYASAFLGG